jgi:hypothetical protein
VDLKLHTAVACYLLGKGGTRHANLGKIDSWVSFIGAVAIGPTVPVQAQGFYLDAPGVHIGVGDPYYHRRYYNYSGGWRTWNGCPPDWTIQGGVCEPYRHGPWDYGYGWYR